jgi:hypothetical protein
LRARNSDLSASEVRAPEWQEWLPREAIANSALQHRHVCTIDDLDIQDGAPVVVMECLSGETQLRWGSVPKDFGFVDRSDPAPWSEQDS